MHFQIKPEKKKSNIFSKYLISKKDKKLEEEILAIKREAGRELMAEILRHSSLQFKDKKLNLRTYSFTITESLLRELGIEE